MISASALIGCEELVFLQVLEHATAVEQDAVVGGAKPVVIDPDHNPGRSCWMTVDLLVEDHAGSFEKLHPLTICGTVDVSQRRS